MMKATRHLQLCARSWAACTAVPNTVCTYRSPRPTTASDPSVAVDPATKILRIEKMARINDDGYFDWELVPDLPAVLAKEMDTYHPQLPFMVGTPFVAVI
ncbi:hypothetical protein HBH70_175440 [Parastagonospora nodorum]|nr:hypothetical protein HBH52_195310 [Parastagonospora nodorum]KAH4092674.1 hypothetical protein HBH46_181660 [Parastagonospora nodorum]KAH4191582.1 hypothetical protein HBI95_211800 [Parastagonospora nodorum]KAH4236907.1 hypothetical protein HBI06_046260 [Parastagonospora nodorum]KAH4248239.1 hypothetical protein HBI05_016610 [Parastagonospora nodorum]